MIYDVILIDGVKKYCDRKKDDPEEFATVIDMGREIY